MSDLFQALLLRFSAPPAILPRARQRFEGDEADVAPAEDPAAPLAAAHPTPAPDRAPAPATRPEPAARQNRAPFLPAAHAPQTMPRRASDPAPAPRVTGLRVQAEQWVRWAIGGPARAERFRDRGR